MRIALCTLALNEMEWLPRLIEQHRNWPGLAAWIFVEAADVQYAKTNPDMVNKDGLSIDGTSEFLARLPDEDQRITYIPMRPTGNHLDPSNGKLRARDAYMRELETVRPDLFIILDADEFYTHKAQEEIPRHARGLAAWGRTHGFILPFRHVWRPPSIADQPLFSRQATGGFFDMAHCHVWRWQPGMGYTQTHVNPTLGNNPVPLKTIRAGADGLECIHMAFASSLKAREAKHRYYAQRGEAMDPKRSWYVQTRAAWETWQPGDRLPRGARVEPYTGAVPEVFQEQP